MLEMNPSVFQRIYFACWITCLAVLPMSHTIAFRNFLLLLLLIFLGIHFVRQQNRVSNFISSFKYLPRAFGVWALFLLLFPLWSIEPHVAWLNFLGQWGESLLAWLIGFTAYWVLGNYGPTLRSLAIASAMPIVIHLLLTVLAWGGALGASFPTGMEPAELWSLLSHNYQNASIFIFGLSNFPWGFRGLEPMHGNLGYAACQAIILFIAMFYAANLRKNFKLGIFAPIAIGLCIASTLIASSRGAFLYIVIIFVLVAFSWYLKPSREPSSSTNGKMSFSFLPIGIIVGFCVFFLAATIITKDSRWQTMVDKVYLGLSQENPMQLLCEGLSPDQETKIRQTYAHHSTEYVDDLINGLKGQDGGRILLMRAGLDMVFNHPIGLDGSRSSYKKLIEKKCGHKPELDFANLHQSWMDLALGLGWLGAGLFAWLLVSLARTGWRQYYGGGGETAAWGLALFLLATFWFARGFADTLYREHYLQMQAMVMGCIYGRLFFFSEKTPKQRLHMAA